MTKNLLYILSIGLFALISCEKDDASLGDYELFKRLQSGSGSWKVEQVEVWENTEENPNILTSHPTNDFFHFFIHTQLIADIEVDLEFGSFYTNGMFSWKSKVESETERVSFVTGLVGEGDVWTVELNKKNKQIWSHVNGSVSTRITLKKCNCEFPKPYGEMTG
ncbi:hypothetical protein [Brumimicrobium sp.]|uniref:hypothetical protein n=1 Tax=Brumimicrobium sp. TaxID=2029867 RepID=UPI003A9052C7